MKPEVFIVAGNHREAEYWADQWKLAPQEWVYVLSADSLRGYDREPPIMFCGSPEHHPDYEQIKQEVAIMRGRYTVLATNPSKSNPNKQHEVRRGGDGVIYCTCIGWQNHKHCSHLDAWNAANSAGLPITPTTVANTTVVAKDRYGNPHVVKGKPKSKKAILTDALTKLRSA